MKVSLKEARRTERRIGEYLNNTSHKIYANVNIYSEQSVISKIDEEKKKTEDSINNTVELINARSEIRRIIQTTNETSGINEKIAARENYINLLGLWQDINNAGDNIIPVAQIVNEIKHKLKNPDTYTSNIVGFSPITEELKEYAMVEIRNNRRNIDECDDNLAALNATTKIEISDRIYKLLQDLNII